MMKFGRKFFFDKVYTKRNYTVPIIIGIAVVIIIITTFLLTRYFKDNTPKEKPIKVTLIDNLEIEIFSKLPEKEQYFKEIKNISYNDFEIIYPENMETFESLSECEDIKNFEECKTILATTIGNYKVKIKTDKLNPKEYEVTLKVVDKTKPTLKLKEVTITEGKTFKINDFIDNCSDNSKTDCTYEYAEDYSKVTAPGEYKIKIIAKDISGNATEETETKLTINKKKTENKNEGTSKPNVCNYGGLSYSDTYVVATKVENKKCAISIDAANDLANKAAIKHNQKLAKEIQDDYLKRKIEPLGLEGNISYDIAYGLVFNKENKGVVGYFLMAEAKQTINNKTITIAKYYINESGNKVWKVNTLNLK